MKKLKKYLEDLEDVIAYKGIGKNSTLSHTDLMYCAREIANFSKENNNLAIDLGTGRGQSVCLLSLLAHHVITVDIRSKSTNISMVRELVKRYGNFDRVLEMTCDSCSGEILNKAREIGKVDILFVDTLHTAKQVKQEIKAWFPLLSDDAVVFFHDAVWCADTVTTTVLELASDKTHKEILHKSETIDNWPGIGKVGINDDGRPYVQSIGEIIDAPYQYSFVNEQWESHEQFNSKKHDISLSLEMRWPGMIVLRNGNISWNELVQRLK